MTLRCVSIQAASSLAVEESSLAIYSFCGYSLNPEQNCQSPLQQAQAANTTLHPRPRRAAGHQGLSTVRVGASLLPRVPHTLSHRCQCRHTYFFLISRLLSECPSGAIETTTAMRAYLGPLPFSSGMMVPCPPARNTPSCTADLGILCLPVSR